MGVQGETNRKHTYLGVPGKERPTHIRFAFYYGFWFNWVLTADTVSCNQGKQKGISIVSVSPGSLVLILVRCPSRRCPASSLCRARMHLAAAFCRCSWRLQSRRCRFSLRFASKPTEGNTSGFGRRREMAVVQKKTRNSKMGCPEGKWKHGPKSAVCPSCLILSHTQMGFGDFTVSWLVKVGMWRFDLC